MSSSSTSRVRNPRGHGDRLRNDLLAAARRLLEHHGVEDAVTLRAVAREVGVTPSAIYPHFAGRQDMIEAVIADAYADFAQLVRHESCWV